MQKLWDLYIRELRKRWFFPHFCHKI